MDEFVFWFSQKEKEDIEDRLYDPAYPNFTNKPRYWNGIEVTSLLPSTEYSRYPDAIVVGVGREKELTDKP